MSTPDRPTDDELAGRIRGATEHYVLERPSPVASAPRAAHSPRRAASLLAAAVAGAALTLAAVTVLGVPGAQRAAGTSASPTTSPGSSGTPVRSDSPGPSATPAPTRVAAAYATRTCLADPGEIVDDWIGPDQTAEEVRNEMMTLPLIHEEQRDHAALFVYANQHLFIMCQIDRSSAAQQGEMVLRGVREDPGIGITFGGGTSGGGGTTIDGQFIVPDLLAFGSAAAHIDRVDIVLEGGAILEAWVGDGMWVAWWNDSTGSVAVRGHASDGTVTTVDEGLPVPPAPDEAVPDAGPSPSG